MEGALGPFISKYRSFYFYFTKFPWHTPKHLTPLFAALFNAFPSGNVWATGMSAQYEICRREMDF